MFRLYDRHLGTGWHEHSGVARIWEGIENVDDGEFWETHLSLKSRLLEFVRSRAIFQGEDCWIQLDRFLQTEDSIPFSPQVGDWC
jgi:hypothetical protein